MLGCARTYPSSVKSAATREMQRLARQMVSSRAQEGGSTPKQVPVESEHVDVVKADTQPYRVTKPRSLMGTMLQQMQSDIEEMSDLMGMPRRRFGLIDPFVSPFDTMPEARTMGMRIYVDMKETDEAYEFKADLPGVGKDQVSVKMSKDKILEIRAERKSEESTTNDKVVFQERSHGSFVRRFKLPENVSNEGVTAKQEDGVLTIVVPKTEKVEESRTITVE